MRLSKQEVQRAGPLKAAGEAEGGELCHHPHLLPSPEQTLKCKSQKTPTWGLGTGDTGLLFLSFKVDAGNHPLLRAYLHLM